MSKGLTSQNTENRAQLISKSKYHSKKLKRSKESILTDNEKTKTQLKSKNTVSSLSKNVHVFSESSEINILSDVIFELVYFFRQFLRRKKNMNGVLKPKEHHINVFIRDYE